MRGNIESKNVWQQILGRKHLGSKVFWMKFKAAKWGTILLKGIFLGGNFGEHVLEEQILLWRKFGQQSFWRIREKKNTGKQKCFGGKTLGVKIFESKLLSLMVSP